jgi:hypothetical protein
MIKLPERWVTFLKKQAETGMSAPNGTIYLNDRKLFKQAVISADFVTKVRGFQSIPFTSSDISQLEVTHDKWER